MIQITKIAQEYLKKLLLKQEKGTNIRVFVIHPGTPSAECGVSYCPISSVETTDKVIKLEKFLVYIDELSFPYLKDAEIDYVIDDYNSQLTLKAPNAKIRKVSEDAPLIEKVEYLIQSKINPQLASHGGQVSLIQITDDGYAILKFGGGCNGCSMINITLKNGIEKEILAVFPNLKGVRDITEHYRGKHSYY